MKIDPQTAQAALMQRLAAMQTQAGGSAVQARLAGQPGAEGFAASLRTAIQQVNQDQNLAGQLMSAVDSGQSDDLVGAMVISQKASLSFSALMQVRNKLMSGLDDIMRLPL